MPNQFKMSMVAYCYKWNRPKHKNMVTVLIHDNDLDSLIEAYENEKFWEEILEIEIKWGSITYKSRGGVTMGTCKNAQEVADAYRTAISIVKGL